MSPFKGPTLIFLRKLYDVATVVKLYVFTAVSRSRTYKLLLRFLCVNRILKVDLAA
jgi:hypothetical protein